MMHKPVTHILLFGLTDSDAEQLTAGFRRAGQVCREVRLDSAEHLTRRLTEQRWDLLVIDGLRAPLDVGHCGNLIRKYELDLPVILVGEGDPLSPPDASVADVFGKFEFPRLTRAALREVSALASRRQLVELQHSLAAAEKRSELLMHESREAVAYLIDGMIIHANPVFRDQLGFDDLDGFPIVDLVQYRDQDRLKNALKQQQKGQQDRQLDLNLQRRDGSLLAVTAACSNAHYDDEDCIQLVLHEPGGAADAGAMDETTGLPNRNHFAHLLQEFVENERNSNSSMLLLAIDRFSQLRHVAGLTGVEGLVSEVAGQFAASVNAQICGRVSDDILAAVAHHVPSQQAAEMAEDLVKHVEESIFEVRKQSMQCTVSIAIMPINHLSPPKAHLLLDQCFNFLEKIFHDGGNQARIYRRDRQQLDGNESAAALVSEALASHRLQLLFEPMVNLGSASGDHYEVCLALKDRNEGEVSAGELLRNVEQDPDNNQLDRWILVEATKMLAKERLNGQDIKLVVNLSGNVFHDTEFCSWLGVAIKAAGLPADSLILQFREESLGNSLKPALDFCKQLQQMGSEVAVSNFGRTPSAEKFLQHIRPALVKPSLRKSEALDNEKIRGHIKAAKALNSRILIPHVGSAAALATLWQLSPDFIQGSYVHEPQPTMSYEFSAFS